MKQEGKKNKKLTNTSQKKRGQNQMVEMNLLASAHMLIVKTEIVIMEN